MLKMTNDYNPFNGALKGGNFTIKVNVKRYSYDTQKDIQRQISLEESVRGSWRARYS